MIITSDGKMHPIFTENDKLDLVEEYMGREMRKEWETDIGEIEILRDELVDAKLGAEFAYEDCRNMLVDIRDMAEEMIDMVNRRINKETLRYKLQRIYDLTNSVL